MVRALHMLSLPVEGVHHRGVDDAWNTGLLLSRLLLASRAALKVEAD
jgi:inhibitor of KinA sporulation pathway (predicted exonuclease)